MSRVLIVEDETVIRTELRRLLSREGYDVAEAGSVTEAEREHQLDGFDLVLADLRLPGAPGTELITKCNGVPVLVMTSYATVRSAVEAMKLGAVDYLSKPFDHEELLMVIARALANGRLRRQNQQLRRDVERSYSPIGMVGDCPAMQEVVSRLNKVAATDTTVLVLGESGTGKELVARAVHERSKRRDAALVTVNCAAIPENLLESELFGHEKGAFTGALSSHVGLVEEAHGGTLFLDEIGELPASAQARLLRLLQESELRRVGATRTIKVNVRVIAATHRDLETMIRNGQFRSDLYFRLRVFEIRLPPLRERKGDLPILAVKLLEKVRARLNRPQMILSPEALTALSVYPWPGNVRELENALERAVILCEGTVLTPDLLALEPTPPSPSPLSFTPSAPPAAANNGHGEGATLEDYFVRFVREHEDLMDETQLAEALGISRKSLWERRQRLNLLRKR
jgi:DNA-binding NtrC family response regulator